MPEYSVDFKKLLLVAHQTLEDSKARELQEIYIGDISSIADVMIVVTATSNRHSRAIANALRESLRENECHLLSVEGEDTGEWILVDAGDLLIHIMLADTREFYELEKLWSIRPGKV
jgi:ribosome-associated protein